MKVEGGRRLNVSFTAAAMFSTSLYPRESMIKHALLSLSLDFSPFKKRCILSFNWFIKSFSKISFHPYFSIKRLLKFHVTLFTFILINFHII